MNEPKSPDYDQPIAYDANGQPLYAHPPKDSNVAPKPQAVHVARPVEPEPVHISDEIKSRHDESVKLHPQLNLSESEYVIMTVRRHPIALVIPLGLGVLVLGIAWALQINYGFFVEQLEMTGRAADPSFLLLPVLGITALVVLFMAIAYYIYDRNRFYLTNESVIQNIQFSLFAKREQTVSLGSVEDASYIQAGILPHLLDYGTIRLSTVGDENSYELPYVGTPKLEIATLNNAVEAFKNGRRVGN